MRIGAFLPFSATYYLNGHNIIASMLAAYGVRFRREENAFLSVSDPSALQAAAERIDPSHIQEPLDYWSFMLGPKFSRHEGEGIDLRRYYYLSHVEYAQNIVFKRNHPIHSIFERSCDLGLARIIPQRMEHIFCLSYQTRSKTYPQSLVPARLA
jgi:hypothetical protein